MATSPHAINSRYRIFIQVGILGPSIGGQCILDIPLLTALNLCAFSISGQTFTSLNQQQTPESTAVLKRVLGLPTEAGAMLYECHDQWIKSIDVDLGSLYEQLAMNISIRLNQAQEPKSILVRPRTEKKPFECELDTAQKAHFSLEDYHFQLHVKNLLKIGLMIDESEFTLAPAPQSPNSDHILAHLGGEPALVKGASALVKSRFLELSNQLVPSLIPPDVTGDISTPRLIPGHQRKLPLPLKKFQSHRVIMGIGPLGIFLNLCHIADLNSSQLNILKSLFDYTFYHPELKRIYG